MSLEMPTRGWCVSGMCSNRRVRRLRREGRMKILLAVDGSLRADHARAAANLTQTVADSLRSTELSVERSVRHGDPRRVIVDELIIIGDSRYSSLPVLVTCQEAASESRQTILPSAIVPAGCARVQWQCAWIPAGPWCQQKPA